MQATYLITLRGLIALILCLVILPILNHVLSKRYRMDAVPRDLRVAQISAALLTVGALGMGLTETVPFFAVGLILESLGSAFHIALRSVITALVHPSHLGTLYASIALTQNIGALTQGPVIAAAFKKGMRLGGVLTGLPYIIMASVFFLSFLAVAFIRLPSKEERMTYEAATEVVTEVETRPEAGEAV